MEPADTCRGKENTTLKENSVVVELESERNNEIVYFRIFATDCEIERSSMEHKYRFKLLYRLMVPTVTKRRIWNPLHQAEFALENVLYYAWSRFLFFSINYVYSNIYKFQAMLTHTIHTRAITNT